MKYLDRIESYLNDDLSEEARASFEKDCQTNPELTEELAFYIKAQQAFKQKKLAALTERYQGIKGSNVIAQHNSNRRRLYIGIASSAAVIALLILVGLPIFNNSKINNQLAARETHIQLLSQTRSEVGDQNIIEKTSYAVLSGNYELALNLLDSLPTNAHKASLLKASTYFGLKQYEKAAAAYEIYIKSNPDEYEDFLFAQWNLSLAYRFSEQSKKEKEVLQRLTKEDKKNIVKYFSSKE